MLRTRRLNRLAAGGSFRFCIALVFLALAGLSALAHADPDTRSVEGFDIDTVILRGSDELKISFGDINRLLVKGGQRDLDAQPFYVRGRTMKLGYSERGKRVQGVKYLLEVTSLKHITLEGSGAIYVDSAELEELQVKLQGSGDIRMYAVTADELECTVAGSGDLQLAEANVSRLAVELAGSGDIALGKISARKMDVTMSGSGDITATREAEGSDVEELEIALAGSGDIDLARLKAQRVEISIAGSGNVDVWAEQDLDVSTFGSGDVSYRGDPALDSRVMGSGEISRAD